MHEALRHFNVFLRIEILTFAIINSILLRLFFFFFFPSLDVTHAASIQDSSSASPISFFPSHTASVHFSHVRKHGQCCWPQANSVTYLCRALFLGFIVILGSRFLA